MPVYKKFIIFVVGFFIGIFVYDFCMCSEWVKLAILCVGGVGVFGFLVRKLEVLSGFGCQVAMCLLLGVCLGIFRYFVADLYFENDIRNVVLDKELKFYACISDEVDVRDGSVKYTVSGNVFDGKILLNASRFPEFNYGDEVLVSGILEKPAKIDGFSYDKYLERFGIYVVSNQPKIEKVGECGNVFFKSLYEFKKVFEKRIAEIFPEPYSSFIAGLLLGSRKGIPKDVSLEFNNIGLTHIVAISGYNITLIITLVTMIFGFLSRKKRVVVSIVFIIVFVLLVGASGSVVRAAIMGAITLIGVYFGRVTIVYVSLALSAFLMNAFNPKIVIYDIGFQLSFLATLGLTMFASKFANAGGWFGVFLSKIPKTFSMRENLSMTLSAQVFTVPVILKNFGRISFICPLANIVLIPFVPVIMLVSFVAVVLSFLNEDLGKIVGFFDYVVLKVFFFLVGVFNFLS